MKAAILTLLAASLAVAQAPRFVNARLESEPAANLSAQLAAAERGSAQPLWWGYSVPGVPADGGCGTIVLDGRRLPPQSQDGPLIVLLRIEARAVARVRSTGTQCNIDAGGDRVIWLGPVDPAQSAALLSSLTTPTVMPGALAALALSSGSAAERALESLANSPTPEVVREKAVFWLGSARGHAGFLALQHLARAGGDPALGRRIAFALSVSPDPGAIAELIRQAQDDPSPPVRGQALFWLAHKAGAKSAGAISAAVANDPSTQVKERAVFALSQLPPQQGVPLLIHVAQTNSNPAVRKRAMFWLGQTHDPRALAFFRQILQH